ncbi:YusU family protein [Aeribacillus pallidus]|uniref:YusU family protein n=1 Tax=unclassified Aeribacillus TaxID=2640495 RepID=UPI0028727E60|nr:YusU family protein [Aeribacillus pallidus]
MDNQFQAQVDALVEKYTELLLGKSSPELKEKVKIWVLYTYMAKSMPPLVKHWNEKFPEAKEQMKAIINEIKELNEQHRNNRKR